MKSIGFVLNTIAVLILLIVIALSATSCRPVAEEPVSTIVVVRKKCKAPTIIKDEQPWTDQDAQAFERAAYTCRTRYKRCLVRFKRIEYGQYHATCGEGTNG